MKSSILSKTKIARGIALLVGLFLIGEIARDIFREGDFAGYITAGGDALRGTPIYNDLRNTWPPFFSIFAIPLYYLNTISPVVLRLMWLLGILIAYVKVFGITIAYQSNKSLQWTFYEPLHPEKINLLNPYFFIPFLLTFRILIEEISNIQINVFLLFGCMLALQLINDKKKSTAGLVLGFLASLKVYPILLLPLLIIKKEFKVILYVAIAISSAFLFSSFYFGWEQNIELHKLWYNQQVASGPKCHFKNMSIWGVVCRYFSEGALQGFDFNIALLSNTAIQKVSLGLISILGLFTFFQFTKNKYHFKDQYFIVLAYLPLLSPLAWKYYFVFFAPLVISLYLVAKNKQETILFYTLVLIFTLTSELFIGNFLSDVTEELGIMTFSSLVIIIFAHFKLKINE